VAAKAANELPVDYEAQSIHSCPATAVVRRRLRIAQLPLTSLLGHALSCLTMTGWRYFCTNAWKIAVSTEKIKIALTEKRHMTGLAITEWPLAGICDGH
jgi:hypothetical protein